MTDEQLHRYIMDAMNHLMNTWGDLLFPPGDPTFQASREWVRANGGTLYILAFIQHETSKRVGKG
jgi:hypothetical protein